jgi:hypothetical protein
MRVKLPWDAAVGFAFLSAVIVLAPQGARGSIVEDIFEQGTSNQLGTFSFPSLSGTSATGADLSYTPFTAADITSIPWTFDPSNLDVVALNLNALQGDNACDFSTGPCSNSTLILTVTSTP